jgi:hypothetical protein
MICIARIFGAPFTVPAGNVARIVVQAKHFSGLLFRYLVTTFSSPPFLVRWP